MPGDAPAAAGVSRRVESVERRKAAGGFVAAALLATLGWPSATQALLPDTQLRDPNPNPSNNTLIKKLLAQSEAKRAERYQEMPA